MGTPPDHDRLSTCDTPPIPIGSARPRRLCSTGQCRAACYCAPPVNAVSPPAGTARPAAPARRPSPIGVPSARQQAAPVIVPSAWNWIALMPPATLPTTATSWPRSRSAASTPAGTAGSTSSAVALGPDPRRLHGFLHAHAVVDQVGQRLHHRREDAQPAGQAQREAAACRRAAPSPATSRTSPACPAPPKSRGRGAGRTRTCSCSGSSRFPARCSGRRTGELMVWVLATMLPAPSATVRCVVWAPSPGATPALQLCARVQRRCARGARRHSPSTAASLTGTCDEGRVGGGGGAVGEGDLQHLGQQVQRVGASRSPARRYRSPPGCSASG